MIDSYRYNLNCRGQTVSTEKRDGIWLMLSKDLGASISENLPEEVNKNDRTGQTEIKTRYQPSRKPEGHR
jgi:hypothetical protein